MCILIQYCIVLIIVAFNEIWDVSSNFVLFQNHFVYSGSLAFHMTFRVIFNFCKSGSWNFYSDCVESVCQFEECWYFDSIKFSIQATWDVFPFVLVFSFLQ